MEDQPIPEGQALKQKLMQVLQKVQDGGKLEKDYVPDRGEQREVLEKLPDNLEQQLRGFYLASNLGQSEGDKATFSGEFMEVIVKSLQKEKLSPTGEILLELMHNPKRFGIKKGWSSLINPDTVYLKVNETGDVVVEEVGEVKKKKLGSRGLEQLRKKGFQRSFRMLTEIFKRKSIAGHPELSRFHNKSVILSPDFKQVLFTSINNIIEPREYQSKKDKNRYQTIMRSVDIQTLPFTFQEIDAMADFLWDKI